MKRYAIVEVPEGAYDATVRFYSDADSDMGGTTIGNSGILNGPVELMEAATKEAGVKYEIPKPGDYYFGLDDMWSKRIFKGLARLPVITAIEPEKEKPCWNCQTTKQDFPKWRLDNGVIVCSECFRPASEWTYAKPEPEPEKPCPNCHWTAEWQVADPGGIGCGGTGGPLC